MQSGQPMAGLRPVTRERARGWRDPENLSRRGRAAAPDPEGVSGLINALGLTPMSSSKWKFLELARVSRVAFTTERFVLDATILNQLLF